MNNLAQITFFRKFYKFFSKFCKTVVYVCCYICKQFKRKEAKTQRKKDECR